jgi:hypothetical protein
VKTKLRSHVQVIKDGNDKVTERENVFQLDELVDSYRVISFTKLEENLNFYIAENTYVHVGISYLNHILCTSRHIEVDEDEQIKQLQFNEEDNDGHEDDKNEDVEDFD